MIRLVVRLDPIAALRHTPGGRTPDLHAAAHAAQLGGAAAVRLAWREGSELEDLARHLDGPLQLDVGLDPAHLAAALRLKPERICLRTEGPVPEPELVGDALERLAKAGIASSLRLPPTEAALLAANEAGAVWADLDTSALAAAATEGARVREFLALRKAVSTAAELGLRVTLGGGLGAALLPRIAPLSDVEEVHVGFSALARALFTGLTQAVRDLRGELAQLDAAAHAEAGDGS